MCIVGSRREKITLSKPTCCAENICEWVSCENCDFGIGYIVNKATSSELS